MSASGQPHAQRKMRTNERRNQLLLKEKNEHRRKETMNVFNISANMILCHLVGDYLLQSDWMATKKAAKGGEGAISCLAHALVYTLPFLLLTSHPKALCWIFVTHYIIDRYRLARYVVFAKNFLAPRSGWPPPWAQCTGNGYPPDRPLWLTTWLFIIADNTLHLIMNGSALSWF